MFISENPKNKDKQKRKDLTYLKALNVNAWVCFLLDLFLCIFISFKQFISVKFHRLLTKSLPSTPQYAAWSESTSPPRRSSACSLAYGPASAPGLPLLCLLCYICHSHICNIKLHIQNVKHFVKCQRYINCKCRRVYIILISYSYHPAKKCFIKKH